MTQKKARKRPAPKPPTRTRTRRPAPPARPERRAGPASSGLAPGMQAVNAYLAVANVAATMDFMERVFGFSRGVVLPDPDGRLRYAEMRHGESVLMLIRKGEDRKSTRLNSSHG